MIDCEPAIPLLSRVWAANLHQAATWRYPKGYPEGGRLMEVLTEFPLEEGIKLVVMF